MKNLNEKIEFQMKSFDHGHYLNREKKIAASH